MKTVAILLTAALFLSFKDPLYESARNDLKRMNEVLTSMERMSIDTYYNVYRNYNSHSPIESKKGKFIRFGGKIYTKIADVETIELPDKIISVNQDTRIISVGDNKPLDVHPLQMNLDSALTLCAKIRQVQVNDYERKYELHFPDGDGGELSRMDIHINTSSFRLSKVVLFYAVSMNLKSEFYGIEEQPRLEISYLNYRMLQEEPSVLQASQYVVQNAGRLQAAPKYYNYRLSDLRNQVRFKNAR